VAQSVSASSPVNAPAGGFPVGGSGDSGGGGGGGISAPGAVTLGTPTGAGIPYTMPSLPTGAGSLILQRASDDGFGEPDDNTWASVATGLAGGATGTVTTGTSSTQYFFRAKNTTGGLTGPASAATTVALPAAPSAPSGFSDLNEDVDVQFTLPALPARATGYARLEVNVNSAGWTTAQNTPSPGSYTYQNAAADVPLQFRLVAQNVYGTTNGSAASHTPSGGIAAPGAVTLGTPTGAGIPWTLPAVPSGAESLTLEKCGDDDGDPDGNWVAIAEEQAGEAEGMDDTGADGGSAYGQAGARFHYRAKNTVGGLTGPATSAVAVALPAAPAAPTMDQDSGTALITTPALPARASGFVKLVVAGTGPNSPDDDFLNDPHEAHPDPLTEYSAEGRPSGQLIEAWLIAQNIYGESEAGAIGSLTIT
jgi:hypothetical protein